MLNPPPLVPLGRGIGWWTTKLETFFDRGLLRSVAATVSAYARRDRGPKSAEIQDALSPPQSVATGSSPVEGALGPRRLPPVQLIIVEGPSPIFANDGSPRRKHSHRWWPSRVLQTLQLVKSTLLYPKDGAHHSNHTNHPPQSWELVFRGFDSGTRSLKAPIRRNKLHFGEPGGITFTAGRSQKVCIFSPWHSHSISGTAGVSSSGMQVSSQMTRFPCTSRNSI